ncbi:MAG TPA: single-stranded-DNA-specific exonuclease RecJ [Phycisphaerales bacterium]|nr:single-stranded-DNA-specific exonuclease RecJ [Phycisphaerales bacterium]HMP36411.1 single-stranded-DNA-specific exonuclease RecJ [Phycisphaerales bacterium]
MTAKRECRREGPPEVRIPLLDRLLAARGLGDRAAARAFCEPRLTDLADPGLLPGIDAAVERIALALRRGERIAIYGDYDVDGIAASAILYHVLRAADPDARIRCYVPHRIDEGYGVNADALRELRADGATLVVTVDCGVTATAPALVARAIGLDLIITDHHHPPADPLELPAAVAVVHPALPWAPAPFTELCGAGVAFKLAWRLATHLCGSERVSDRLRAALVHSLPLAALATIADVVPLIGENRVIAAIGLRSLPSTPLTGLRALIERSGLGGASIDAEKVGFVLAPRLNACGRLGHAAEAVRLLTDASPEEAIAIADALDAVNRDRRRMEQRIAEDACARVEATGQDAPDHRAIVLADESWHPGVVGIVCSRLTERFGRPAVLLQRQGELCKGSARSVEGYSIHEGLLACAHELETFGGHAAAAGLSLRSDRLDAFRAALVAHAGAHLRPDDLVPSICFDCDASLAEFDSAAVAAMARLSPFGRRNPRPAFLVRGLTVAEAPRVLKERHLRIVFGERRPGAAPVEMQGIWWNAGAHAPALPRGRRVDAVVEPAVNDWSRRIELQVRDVACAG